MTCYDYNIHSVQPPYSATRGCHETNSTTPLRRTDNLNPWKNHTHDTTHFLTFSLLKYFEIIILLLFFLSIGDISKLLYPITWWRLENISVELLNKEKRRKSALLTWEDRNREAAIATADTPFRADRVLDMLIVAVCTDTPIPRTVAESTRRVPTFRWTRHTLVLLPPFSFSSTPSCFLRLVEISHRLIM